MTITEQIQPRDGWSARDSWSGSRIAPYRPSLWHRILNCILNRARRRTPARLLANLNGHVNGTVYGPPQMKAPMPARRTLRLGAFLLSAAGGMWVSTLLLTVTSDVLPVSIHAHLLALDIMLTVGGAVLLGASVVIISRASAEPRLRADIVAEVSSEVSAAISGIINQAVQEVAAVAFVDALSAVESSAAKAHRVRPRSRGVRADRPHKDHH